MSKADRRKRAGRKMKSDIQRQPNGEPARSAASNKLRDQVVEARARKSKITGRDDLPADVLGILFGHDRIGDAEYNIGRKLERLMNRVYGSAKEGPSAMFREVVSAPSEEDAVATVEPMSDEAAQALLLRMDVTLRQCAVSILHPDKTGRRYSGLEVRDLVVGAVRYERFPTSDDQIFVICEGLVALAKGHAPKMKEVAHISHKAA